MSELRVQVSDPAGLHARQAARLVQLAGRFSSRITIRHDGRVADVKSLIEILGLAIGPSTEIILAAEGIDADEALRVVSLGFAPDPSSTGSSQAHGPSSSDTPDADRRPR